MTRSSRILRAGPRFSRGPALFLVSFLLFSAVMIPSVMAAFRITEIQAELPGCSPALNDLKICMIADLHLSASNRSRRVFTTLTEHLDQLKPDILLIGGDIFHRVPGRDPKVLRQIWQEFMARMKERPPLGIFAVLGNHDKLEDAAEIRDILEKSGVQVLADRTVVIRVKDAVLYLAGTEHRPDEPFSADFSKKIASLRPLILLAHYPEIFDLVPDNAKLLVLAGHTHGGVVHIPGLKKGALASALVPSHRTEYVFGSYGSGEGKRLYVTAGIAGDGSSALRFNNPPEIVVIRPGKIKAHPQETAPASPERN